MLKKILALLPLLAGGTMAIAQTNFRPGYVLPLSGDTLRGEVDSRGAQRNARLVRFRPAAGAASTEYQPRQLRGYGITGSANYESCRLPGRSATLAFVESLVRSEVSLYFMVGSNQQSRFYLRKQQDTTLTELISRDTTMERSINGAVGRVKVHDTRYRTTMHQVFGECEAVQPLIDRTAFTETDLRRVFRAYAACKGEVSGQAPVFESTQQLSKIQLQLLAGAQQTQLSFKQDSYWRGERFISGISPVLGIGLVIRPARFNEKLAMLPQLYWTQVSIRESFFIPPSATTQPAFTSTRSSVIYKVQSVRLPVLLRYTFGTGAKLRAYMQAGPEIVQQLSGQNYAAVEETSVNGSVKKYTAPAFGELRQTAFGAAGGIGFMLPVLGVGAELRYEWLDGISQSPTLSARPHIIGAVVNYTFGM